MIKEFSSACRTYVLSIDDRIQCQDATRMNAGLEADDVETVISYSIDFTAITQR